MKLLNEVIIYKDKGKYMMETPDLSYSYSLSLMDRWRDAELIPVTSTITELSFEKEGTYVLSVKKGDEIDIMVIFYSPNFEKCRSYIINMITCGDNICAPRHDCNNCDSLYQKWNKKLSEALILYDKMISIIDNISLLEDDSIEDRIYNLSNKIISISKRCEACVKCDERQNDKVRILNSSRTIVKKIGCNSCGGKK